MSKPVNRTTVDHAHAVWPDFWEVVPAADYDALEQRCRELEEAALTPLCFCGLPMAKNQHPDAGKPDRILEVGAVYVCVPCLNKANRGHAKSANALRAEVEALRKDAERYRWLRNESMKGNSTCPAVLMVDRACRPAFDEPGYGHVSVRCGSVLDDAIDAALLAGDKA